MEKYIFLFLLFVAGCIAPAPPKETTNQNYKTPAELAALTVEDILVESEAQCERFFLIDLSGTVRANLREQVRMDAEKAIEQGCRVFISVIGTNSASSSVPTVDIQSVNRWGCEMIPIKTKFASRAGPQSEQAQYEAILPHVRQIEAECQAIAAERNVSIKAGKERLSVYIESLRSGQRLTDISGALQVVGLKWGGNPGQVVIYSDMKEERPPGAAEVTPNLNGIAVVVKEYRPSGYEKSRQAEWTPKLESWGAAEVVWEPLVLEASTTPPPVVETAPPAPRPEVAQAPAPQADPPTTRPEPAPRRPDPPPPREEAKPKKRGFK